MHLLFFISNTSFFYEVLYIIYAVNRPLLTIDERGQDKQYLVLAFVEVQWRILRDLIRDGQQIALHLFWKMAGHEQDL